MSFSAKRTLFWKDLYTINTSRGTDFGGLMVGLTSWVSLIHYKKQRWDNFNKSQLAFFLIGVQELPCSPSLEPSISSMPFFLVSTGKVASQVSVCQSPHNSKVSLFKQKPSTELQPFTAILQWLGIHGGFLPRRKRGKNSGFPKLRNKRPILRLWPLFGMAGWLKTWPNRDPFGSRSRGSSWRTLLESPGRCLLLRFWWILFKNSSMRFPKLTTEMCTNPRLFFPFLLSAVLNQIKFLNEPLQTKLHRNQFTYVFFSFLGGKGVSFF